MAIKLLLLGNAVEKTDENLIYELAHDLRKSKHYKDPGNAKALLCVAKDFLADIVNQRARYISLYELEPLSESVNGKANADLLGKSHVPKFSQFYSAILITLNSQHQSVREALYYVFRKHGVKL